MRLRLQISTACFLTAALLASLAVAGEGAPLTRLVADDAGACVELHALAPRVRSLAGGELSSRARSYPPFIRWREEHLPELHSLSTDLRGALGVGARELWNGLLSKNALLAVWPRQDLGGDALLLVEASDEAFLTNVVERLRDAQSTESAWRVVRKFEQGGKEHTVYEIPPKHGKETVFLTNVNALAIASNSERLLDDAIRRLDVEDSGSLAKSELYAKAKLRVSPDAVATLFVNPRAFDEQIEIMSRLPEIDRASRVVFTVARASDYWIGGCELGDMIRFEGFHAWRRQDLPPIVVQAVTLAGGAAEFFEHTPREAVVAFAGRMDLARGRLQSTLRRDSDNASFVEQSIWTLATALGPEGGLYFAPVEAEEKKENEAAAPPLPWGWVVGLGVSNQSGGEDAVLGVEQLRAMFEAGAGLFTSRAEGAKEGAPRLSHDTIDGERISTIGGIRDLLFADAISVHFAPNFVWSASSPLGVVAAARVTPEASLAADSEFTALHSPRMGDAGWIIHLQPSALARQMLAAPAGVDALAARAGLQPEEARRSAEELSSLLRLCDRITLEGRFDEGGVGFAAAISAKALIPAKP